MEQSKTNISKTTWLLLKLGIAGIACWFIYRRVIGREDIETWWSRLRYAATTEGHGMFLLLVVLLMIANWTTEALKWKFMMRKIETVPLGRSLQAVFSGLTVSFFTPNRVGEYAGRVFHLEMADRIEATLITVIENYSQLLVTLVAGSLALIVFLHGYILMPVWLWIGSSVVLVLFSFSCVLVYLNVAVLESVFRRLRVPASWNKYIAVFAYYSSGDILRLLVLAGLRYLIFTTQFFILLAFFGVGISFCSSLLFSALTFYVMAVVPTIAWTELGVRGAVATYFFSKVTDDALNILNASVTLWMINLVIPALIGCVFVFGFRFGRREAA